MYYPRLRLVAVIVMSAVMIVCLSIYLMAKPSEDPYRQLYDGKINIYFRQGVSVSPQRLQEIVSSVGGTVIFRDPVLNNVAITLNPRPKTIADAEKLVKQLERYSEVEFATAATEVLRPH